MSEGYNGWANYETWNWALWLDNDGSGERWRERAEELVGELEPGEDRDNAVTIMSAEMEAECDEQVEALLQSPAGPFADILNAGLREIRWDDIAQHYVDDVEVDEEEKAK